MQDCNFFICPFVCVSHLCYPLKRIRSLYKNHYKFLLKRIKIYAKHVLIKGAKIIHHDIITAPWVNCHLGGS